MVGTQRTSGVRAASDTTIEIDFYYRGARCRERLKLPPTARNLQYAANLLGQIRVEIEKNVFDYAKHFPRSRRAKRLVSRPATLDDLATSLRRWLKVKELEIEHSTHIGYVRIVENILIPRCGKILLRDFDRTAAKELVASFDEKTSAKRINNVLGPLRGLLADALDERLIELNPLDGLKVRRRAQVNQREEVDPFSPEEVRAILAACSEPQVRNYCQFNFATGLRTSEMIGLCWSDVDFVAGTVTIRRAWVMGKMKVPKTKSGRRVVTLVAPALAALKAQQAHTRLAGEFVFHDPKTGARWGSDQTLRAGEWQRALKRARVRYRYPYQMRHTFASQALSAGENIMWVAQQMGHHDWTITAKKYARWIPSIVPDAGGKVAALWSDPLPAVQP